MRGVQETGVLFGRDNDTRKQLAKAKNRRGQIAMVLGYRRGAPNGNKGHQEKKARNR